MKPLRSGAASVEWTLAQPGNEEVRSVNAVVGETNDGMLNDIRGRHVTIADARRAIESARAGPVEEGAVGGFGSHVAQLLADEGVFDHGLKFRSMVLPDIFIDQASPKDMYAVAAMNAEHIEAKVLEVMGVTDINSARA